MALDGGHGLDPVDTGVGGGEEASEAPGEGVGLAVLLGECVAMLGVVDRCEEVLRGLVRLGVR